MAPTQDRVELQRTESFQFPAGHVNHLNDSQLKSLEQFKQICKEKGYWTASTGREPASHDDETLLRYLRARKFVPADAYKQFKDTEDWRSENQLDKLYETIDVEEYDQSRRLYPQWLGRRDKRGIPVYLFEIAHLDSKAIAAYQSNTDTKMQTTSNVPVKMLRLFALYENLCRFVLPLCSAMKTHRQHPETPISQSSNIVDISGVSLMQFWKLKNHMQDASILATAHYPETLDRIFLLGAPSFFPTVWSWVKKWFDPITVSKIFILSQKETLPTLLRFIDIDDIPKKYGGNLDFKFGDLPMIDHDISSQLKWTDPAVAGKHRTLPTGPIKWRHNANGDLEAIAVGTEGGVQRNKVIAGIHPDSGIAMLSLSPGRVQTGTGPKTADTMPALATVSENANSKPAVTPAPVQTADSNSAIAPAPLQTADSKSVSAPAPVHETATPNPKTQPASSTTGYTPITFTDYAKEPADTTMGVRQGTSETRYEQQAHTHAHGNAEEATPEVTRDGRGEKQAIMEPSTVGQAPKERPIYDEPVQQPSTIEQVKHTAEVALQQATEASQSILAAVGLGSKKPEEPVTVKEKAHDPAVESMSPAMVEEMLRARHMSTSRS